MNQPKIGIAYNGGIITGRITAVQNGRYIVRSAKAVETFSPKYYRQNTHNLNLEEKQNVLR